MPNIRKAYKFRLKTNDEQDRLLHTFCGHARFVWNKALVLNLERLSAKQNMLWYGELDYWTKLWKKSDEYGFLKELPSQVLQQKIKDLEKAFKDGFDKNQPLKKMPVKKKRFVDDSIRFPQGFKIDNRRIFLPKLGWVGFHKSCEIQGKPKNITVSRKGKHWYASVQVEQTIEIVHQNTWPEVGIDMGISCFVALSDGTMEQGVNSFRNHEKKLSKEQRKLSRKQKGSNNWKKQKDKINRLHIRIADVRNDYLHKLSTQISKNHAVVYVEALKVRNMSASAKGTIKEPGRMVKQKSGLNKSILDQGWGEFRRQLEYKLKWNGGKLVEVDPKYTSQQCSCCGYTHKENRPSQANFICMECGYSENADINAAKNILTLGQRGMACQANRIGGRQQEPAGNRKVVLPKAS